MPLPAVYGAKQRVSHAISGRPSGNATHANHGYCLTSLALVSNAKSAICANRSDTSATSAEPASRKAKAAVLRERRRVCLSLWAMRKPINLGRGILSCRWKSWIKGRLKMKSAGLSGDRQSGFSDGLSDFLHHRGPAATCLLLNYLIELISCRRH